MTIKDSSIASNANSVYKLKFGDLYFYNTFFIVEMKEGVVVNKEDVGQMLDLVHVHFGYDNPYGMISNRVNSYSSDLIDISPFVADIKFLVANAVVFYNKSLFESLELENVMLKLNGTVFFNLNDAIKWTKKKVKNARLLNS
ncbi:hypothetical protein ACS386_12750 [Flavobacteriaceae bacterium LMO-SS05]